MLRLSDVNAIQKVLTESVIPLLSGPGIYFFLFILDLVFKEDLSGSGFR